MMSGNTRGILMMILAMAFFTLNDTLIKAAMENLPLFQAIALRGLGVSLLLGLLGLATGNLLPALSRREHLIVNGRMLCDIGATVTFLTALHHLPLANMSAILQMLPLIMTLSAALLYKEPLGWRRLSAICIGFIGVLFVIKPGSDAFNIWSILALLSVLIVCARDLLTREIGKDVPAVYIALVNALGVTLLGFVGSLFEVWQPLASSDVAYLSVGAVALALALLVVVSAMRHGDVGVVSPFRYTAMIWAILLGFVFFGEIPDALGFLGIALIVGSGIFTLLREARLRHKRATPIES